MVLAQVHTRRHLLQPRLLPEPPLHEADRLLHDPVVLRLLLHSLIHHVPIIPDPAPNSTRILLNSPDR